MVLRYCVKAVAWALFTASMIACDSQNSKQSTTLLVGTVFSSGNPIPEGYIIFIPLDGHGEAVDAKIVDGNYRAPNVPVGNVKAVISAILKGEQRADGKDGEVRYEKIDLVPEKYKKGIRFKVKKDQTTQNFFLRSPKKK